jgi:hypothetical protein
MALKQETIRSSGINSGSTDWAMSAGSMALSLNTEPFAKSITA